jgi:hypothetical protein
MALPPAAIRGGGAEISSQAVVAFIIYIVHNLIV